jgi:hypothetical protein
MKTSCFVGADGHLVCAARSQGGRLGFVEGTVVWLFRSERYAKALAFKGRHRAFVVVVVFALL